MTVGTIAGTVRTETPRLSVQSCPWLRTGRSIETAGSRAGEVDLGGKRVAVLTNGTLLMAGVVSILREQPALQIRSLASNDLALGQELATFRPDVVVVGDSDPALTTCCGLWSLMGQHPGTTVIALVSGESDIQAYTQHRVVGARTADLLDLIVAA